MVAIRIAQGETETLKLTVKKDNSIIDITGASTLFNVYSAVDGTDLFWKAGAILVATDWTYTVAVTSTESAAIAVWKHYCESWVIDAAWNKIQVLEPTPFYITPKLEIPA